MTSLDQQQIEAPQGTASTTAQGGGLPPTGLQQQLQSLNQQYEQAQTMGVQAEPSTGMAEGIPMQQQPQLGTTNLNQIARSLAQSYGLQIGRGPLVDAQGNFTMTPDQIASGSSETMGTAAAKMNYISQALADYQNRLAQQKGIGALQAGLGQVQSRGRGSLAALQSGFYQSLAQAYTDPNMLDQATDFSYFIQKEQLEIQERMQKRALKLAKKKARWGAIGGAVGMIGSLATGNPMGAFASAGQFGTAIGGTGWV